MKLDIRRDIETLGLPAHVTKRAYPLLDQDRTAEAFDLIVSHLRGSAQVNFLLRFRTLVPDHFFEQARRILLKHTPAVTPEMKQNLTQTIIETHDTRFVPTLLALLDQLFQLPPNGVKSIDTFGLQIWLIHHIPTMAGKAATPHLKRHLEYYDRRRSVRPWHAFRALIEIADPELTDFLVDWTVRRSETYGADWEIIVEAPEDNSYYHYLLKLGDAIVQPLLRLLDDEDEYVREHTADLLNLTGHPLAFEALLQRLIVNPGDRLPIYSLGHWKDTRIIEPLLMGLQSGSIEEYKAANALAELGSVDLILPLLEHPHERIYDAAINALGRLGDVKAVESLLALLPRERLHSESLRRLIRALYGLNDARVIPTLILYGQDHYDFAEFVARNGDDSTVELLISHLFTISKTTVHVIEALGLMRNPRAIEPLQQLLQRPEAAAFQTTVLEALIRLSDISAVQPYFDLLHKTSTFSVFLFDENVPGSEAFFTAHIQGLPENAQTSAQVAGALFFRLKEHGFVEPILAGLTSHEPQYRYHAAENLVRLELDAERVTEALLPLLDDMSWPYSNRQVCDAAVEGIEQMGTRRGSEAVKHWRSRHQRLRRFFHELKQRFVSRWGAHR